MIGELKFVKDAERNDRVLILRHDVMIGGHQA